MMPQRSSALIPVLALCALSHVLAQTTMRQEIPDPRTGKPAEFIITLSADGSSFTVRIFDESSTFSMDDLARGSESAYLTWLSRILAARRGEEVAGGTAPGPSTSLATKPASPPRPAPPPAARQPETSRQPEAARKPAYAFVWQNSHGYWFADGPVQLLSVGEKTKEKALEYVIGRNRNPVKEIPYYYKGVYGGGTLILLSGPPIESYERDIATLYNYIP
jgi:hypothetical protein